MPLGFRMLFRIHFTSGVYFSKRIATIWYRKVHLHFSLSAEVIRSQFTSGCSGDCGSIRQLKTEEKIGTEIKEGHSKKLTFLSLHIARKHSASPLNEVSASEVPVYIQKKLFSKEGTSEAAILKLSSQPGYVYVTSFRPHRNWREA